MLSTLVPALSVSVVCVLIFLLLRRHQRRFYAPRTYLGSLREDEKSPELPKGWFNWVRVFCAIPDTYALQHQGLDAYLFLRFLRVCATMILVCLILTWSVLFPVHATGSNGKSQLERISYSNINIETDPNRLYAHTFVGWAVYGFIMYTVTRECIFYITLRQAFLLSPGQSQRISSRTVLFTAVPDDLLDEDALREVFGDERIKHIWIVSDTTRLDELVEERHETAMLLERSLVRFLKAINKKSFQSAAPRLQSRETTHPHAGVGTGTRLDPESISNMRPRHRLGPMGLVGKRVDTIEWARDRLETLIPETRAEQAKHMAGGLKKRHAVFIEFQSQAEAQAAFQFVAHHQALHMAPRVIGIKPEEVIWANLDIPWWQRIIRQYVVYFLTAVLIIFWAVPVGIVGMIAQVDMLKQIRGLTWIDNIPDMILGAVSGLLSSAALAMLMTLVPVLMRMLATLAGAVSLPHRELYTQNAYFCFQLIQVFLIRTLADTASTVLIQIVESPSSIFRILSQAIPTSSNFYISYFILQGLAMSSNVLAQVIGCLAFHLLYRCMADTPRAMYERWTSLRAMSWGSIIPVYTTITVISITYAVVAPLMLFWATLALGLFYLAYRYNVLFVTDTEIDTRGLFYPRALQHLFFGIYLAEICMVGMFSVSRAPGPAALMGAFLVFTILYHIALNRSLGPLLLSLPCTLHRKEQLLRRGQTSGLGSRRGNFLTRFLRPWVHADYEALRELVIQEGTLGSYAHDTEPSAHTYLSPSVTSATPILWIPQDSDGLSKYEISRTKIIEISDEGCKLDKNSTICWDTEVARPPVWQQKIYY